MEQLNLSSSELIISRKHLKRDLFRGTEIDLTFELSESQDLTVTAYVNPSGPEFSKIFNGTDREVNVEELAQEIQMLEARLGKENAEAIASENYEVAEKIDKLRGTVREILGPAMLLDPKDVTDERYKLDDRKRKIAQELGQLTAGKRMERLQADYQKAKEEVTGIVKEGGNDHERRQLQEIVAQEHVFMISNNPQKVIMAIDQLQHVAFQILSRTPDFLIGWFQHLVEKRGVLNDQVQAKNLIEAGKKHIAAEDYDKLLEVDRRLSSLLPQDEKDSKEMQRFTRI